MSTVRANGERRSPAAAISRWALALPVALLLATACASRAPATRVAAARDAILAASADFSRSYERGDTERMVSLYTTDGVIMPPGRVTTSGGAALRQYWTIAPGLRILEHVATPDSIVVEGPVAYDRGDYRVHTIDSAGVERRTFGKYVIVWREVSPGAWRIHVDMWNAAPIPPAPMPPGVSVVARSDWGARPPTLAMRAHTPVRLTIHHTGVAIDTTRSLAQKLVALQQFSQREDSLASGKRKPAWADVPYHFYVAADGSIGAGRDWRYAGDTNTPYDPAGHLLVVVEGNFERDTLTTAQRGALERLVPALAVQHRIPADSLRSHRDYAQTSCPGRDLYDELPRVRELVSRAMRP